MENDRERIKKDVMEIIEKDEEGWGGDTLGSMTGYFMDAIP